MSPLRRCLFVLSLCSLPVIAYAPSAEACACCSEPGQRVESVGKLEGYEKGEIEKLRFGKKARLYMTAAGAQGVLGVQGVADTTDAYELTQRRAGDTWTLSFKDGKGRTGTLAFTVPTHIESFFVDPQDGKAGTDPVLYKEWRINASVATTGIFASAAAPGAPMIRLVLQGRGNSCTSVDQFTSFTLIVSGPSARFTFFGALASPGI